MHLSGRKKGREERRRKWEWEKEEKREGERKRMKKKMKAGGRRTFYCEFLPVVMTTEIRVWEKMWKGERTAPNLPGRGKTTWGEEIEVRSKFSKLKKELRNLKDKKAIWMVGEVRRHDDVCFLGHWSFSISWTRQKNLWTLTLWFLRIFYVSSYVFGLLPHVSPVPNTTFTLSLRAGPALGKTVNSVVTLGFLSTIPYFCFTKCLLTAHYSFISCLRMCSLFEFIA